MRRATPTRTKKTTATSKIAQQIYLRRASPATRIVAKYASAETVPTGLISGGGIKPLTNKAQQPQPPAKPQKAQASPARTTQPPAPAIDPMPANVPPPPYIPPPESGLPPGQPLAPRKQAAASGSFDSKLDMSSVGGKSTDLSSVGGKSVAGFRNGMNSDATAFSNRANLAATQHVTPPPGANYTAHRRRIVNGREVYNDTRSSAHPTWTPTAEYNARFGNPAAPASPATPTTAAAPAPQAIAPGTNMATGKPITPGQPVIAPTTESAQTEIAPAPRRYSAEEYAARNGRQQPAVSQRLPSGRYTRHMGGNYINDQTKQEFDQYGNPAGGTYSEDGNSWQASPDVLRNFVDEDATMPATDSGIKVSPNAQALLGDGANYDNGLGVSSPSGNQPPAQPSGAPNPQSQFEFVPFDRKELMESDPEYQEDAKFFGPDAARRMYEQNAAAAAYEKTLAREQQTPLTPTAPQAAPASQQKPGQPTGQPSGQPSGQPAGQNQQNVAPAAAGQPTPAGQPSGQPAGQTAARPAAEQHAAAEKSLAAAAAPDAPPEAKQQAETDLKGALAAGAEANPAHTAGAKAILSNDTKNPDAVAFQKHLDEKVSDEVITQKVEAAYRENPNPTPEQAGGIFAQAQQFWSDLPLPAKIMLGLGLPLGLVGLGSSVFGEGGLSGLLTGALGLGVAGMVGANYGLFGNDARQMMGQGAIGLGRAMGMNIPGKADFTPEGMAKRQQQVTADVQAAMDAKNDKGHRGGWQAGQQKLDEARKPLDYLASMDEGTAITTLMGAMETNDPSVAKQQYDMLMQKRQELLDPEFLRTQARGQVLQNLPGGDWRETVESRPVLKSLANQALNYVGYGAYPAAQK